MPRSAIPSGSSPGTDGSSVSLVVNPLLAVPTSIARRSSRRRDVQEEQMRFVGTRMAKAGSIATLALGLCSGLALSARADGPPPPPPEAFSACSVKAQGAECVVQFGPHTLSGTCEESREEKLFCRTPPPPPPPEAYSACSGKSEGAACTVQMGPHTIKGSCAADQNEKQFCLPTDMPPPPPR
jgi:hypothetical protein